MRSPDTNRHRGDVHCLIGAYRDHEVSASHPLRLTLDESRKSNALVQEIILGPLLLEHLEHLVADVLPRHGREEPMTP